MERRRIRLNINGIICALITEESDEYMQGLAEEIGVLMRNIQRASPYITLESAALTVALGYCDDAKKAAAKIKELSDRIEELEVVDEVRREEEEQSLAKVSRENEELKERLQELEEKNASNSKAAEENKNLREEVQALRDEGEKLKEESASLSQSLEELKAERENSEDDEDLQDFCEYLREKNESLRAESEQLERENAELKKKLEERPEQVFKPSTDRRNPMRFEPEEYEGLVTFRESK